MIRQRLWLVAAIVMTLAAGSVWLFRFQYVALVVDKLATRQIEQSSLSSLAWNEYYLVANRHMLDLALPDRHATDARVRPESANDLVLREPGRRILLGRRTGAVIDNNDTVKPASVFAAEPGDRISLAVERSWLAWPNFFETNYMTGNSPTWKRYKYYRLTLDKHSGLTVEMLWRYEEFYYPSDHAWINGDRLCEENEPPCGLIRVRIEPRP